VRTRFAIHVSGVLACGLLGCHQGEEGPLLVEWQPLFPDPHRHATDINERGLFTAFDNTIQFVKAQLPPQLEASAGLSNPERSLRVFTACAPQCRLLLTRGAAAELLEIQLPSFLPDQPFRSLVWLDRTILIFDQTVAPGLGVHYAVDVAAEQLLQASPFEGP
jgi:hypothetical protein